MRLFGLHLIYGDDLIGIYQHIVLFYSNRTNYMESVSFPLFAPISPYFPLFCCSIFRELTLIVFYSLMVTKFSGPDHHYPKPECKMVNMKESRINDYKRWYGAGCRMAARCQSIILLIYSCFTMGLLPSDPIRSDPILDPIPPSLHVE